MKERTIEELVERWEDQREIKNLMGRYVNDIMLNRDAFIVQRYWSQRKDICLGLNEGWYEGQQAVQDYYRLMSEYIKGTGQIIADIFPEKTAGFSDEQKNGLGTFRVNPLIAPVIEIAEKDNTAKGLWHTAGSLARVEKCGPTSTWTWGFYMGDFVKENGSWKIWHLQKLLDLDHTCGQSWGRNNVPYPDREEFEKLDKLIKPVPNKPICLREYYHPDRPLIGSPRIPEPYETFDTTFSYGTGRK